MFKEYKGLLTRKIDRRQSLADQLNFAFVEDPYTIVMKDGSRVVCFACEGPDLNSASPEQLDAHRVHANRGFTRLAEGFAYQIDFTRYASAERPERTFPDPVSAMIDHEGALHYAEEGAHHESRTVLTVAWRPPSVIENRVERFLLTGAPDGTDQERQREWLKRELHQFRAAMAPVLKMTPMDTSEQLSHFTSCINGRMSRVIAPRDTVPLDAVLGNQDFVPGFKPRIGGRHIAVVALGGFPLYSHAEVTTFLNELPFAYRFSVRVIPFDSRTAAAQLGIIRRNWFQKKKGARALFSETIGSANGSAFENQHAAQMAQDADEAIAEAESGTVRFGNVTAKVLVTADRRVDADEIAHQAFKVCQNMGFDPRIETYNATEAWFGSIPIHGWYDVRKPLINTRNLADIVPLTSVWSGLATNPCPYYPPNTPALCYGATTGGTPWRLNLHVEDVGHTLMVGGTGSGKSTALGEIAVNARAVPGMQIFFFDKGYSAFVMTKALGGKHLNLVEDHVPLQPLALVDDPTERMKIQGLFEDWMPLQNVRLQPPDTDALHRGLELLAERPVEERTVSTLITLTQNATVCDGLRAYSLAGQLGRFLDADHDVLLDNDLVTFELETLMNQGPKVTIPVLTYLFHRIEGRLDGRPTLIIVDEAWASLMNDTFGPRLEQWLRTLRKKNGAVILATQSLADLANSAYRDIILESCPTKLWLPNPMAHSSNTAELYRRFGKSDRQIEIIADATPKQDYYYDSPMGQRLFQFGLGPAALSFVGAGGIGDVAKARRMIAEHGDRWPIEWLRSRGLSQWADYLANAYRDSKPAINGMLATDDGLSTARALWAAGNSADGAGENGICR